MLGLKLIHKNIFEDPFFSDFFNFEECDSELKVDIVDNEKDFTLYADIPGVDKKDVDLKISEDGVLAIEVNQKEYTGRKFLRKERTVRKLKRSFAFDGIKTDGVEASVENGVLTVKLPKVDISVSNERNIEIK
ncbi:MAG: Hsp20 family protein [Clostridiaceae bacterium]|nr:Hsp20 family protein [Clostridiaceae bacterium]